MQKILPLASQSSEAAPALFLISEAKRALLMPFSAHASSLCSLVLPSPHPLPTPPGSAGGTRASPPVCGDVPCSGFRLESTMLVSVKPGSKGLVLGLPLCEWN